MKNGTQLVERTNEDIGTVASAVATVNELLGEISAWNAAVMFRRRSTPSTRPANEMLYCG